jgi:hypothetical protein
MLRLLAVMLWLLVSVAQAEAITITSGEIFTAAHLDFAPVFDLHGDGWDLVANDHTTGFPLPLWNRSVRNQDLTQADMVVNGQLVKGSLHDGHTQRYARGGLRLGHHRPQHADRGVPAVRCDIHLHRCPGPRP